MMEEHDGYEEVYEPDSDYYYDSVRDEAMLISSTSEALDYIKRYPSMKRYVKQWLEEEPDERINND